MIICCMHFNCKAQPLSTLKIKDGMLTLSEIWPTWLVSLSGSSTMKFSSTVLLNEEENFPPSSSQSITQQPLIHLLVVNEEWRNIFEDKFSEQRGHYVLKRFLCVRPFCSFISCSSSSEPSIVKAMKKNTCTKEKKKIQFNEMRHRLCFLTIHLSVSWVNSRCVRKRLLRAQLLSKWGALFRKSMKS